MARQHATPEDASIPAAVGTAADHVRMKWRKRDGAVTGGAQPTSRPHAHERREVKEWGGEGMQCLRKAIAFILVVAAEADGWRFSLW